MASFQQVYYCKSCKTNVTIDEKGRCKKCGGTSLNRTWSVRFRMQEHSKEIQKRLTGYETKKAAQQAYMDYITTQKSEVSTQQTKLIIEDIFSEYLHNCVPDNEESTIYEKQNIFNRFIFPFFKGKEIKEITKVELLNWQTYIATQINSRTNKPFKYKYLAKIKTVFNKFLIFCEEIYDIPNNFRYIKPIKNKDVKKDIKFWEIETFNRFIKTVDDIMWQTIWYTFMYTGMRFNELRALRDCDIDGDVITISKSMVSKKVKNCKNKIKSTKNNKIVKKKVPDILMVQIKKYKEWKDANKIEPKYLFGGECALSENMIRRKLKKDICSAGIEEITPHGFRHSYVSLLIHLGISTKVIAELIGDTEEQVIKTYGHLYSNAKDTAIDILNQNLNKNLQLKLINNVEDKKVVL